MYLWLSPDLALSHATRTLWALEYCVAAGQAALWYSVMGPSHRVRNQEQLEMERQDRYFEQGPGQCRLLGTGTGCGRWA